MFTDSPREDPLPQVAFASVVVCPRIADAALHDQSVVICISTESTAYIYSDKSEICAECRNRSACNGRADRMKSGRKVERPTRKNPLSMAEANCMRM